MRLDDLREAMVGKYAPAERPFDREARDEQGVLVHHVASRVAERVADRAQHSVGEREVEHLQHRHEDGDGRPERRGVEHPSRYLTAWI
ncbi:hypothetical protein M0R88_05010 [Halorussus gelatinilyticus]|uniref:Uncharacterized protein n=1 Tax=Halorussus gelatinilyticus TaxID=2937524 RepID=A0A8U0ILD5_9EURY|nr:hypothetical protein [Halorussus gelatinilyticus]UPW01465.1 hypothetical protein M0R88_05010 [Halorussus gelatinilyticus]